MKVKLIFCTVLALMLLCACQAGTEPQDIPEDPPAVEQSEQETPPADDRVEEEEKEEKKVESPYPPAPPVCEMDFTETESFPFPFEDELLTDDLRGLLLSTEQALYDYDTMWQLLEENYPYLEAIKRELGIDWEEVKAEYRQTLEGHDYGGYIPQSSFIETIDGCLREFQSVGHLFLIEPATRLARLSGFKNIEDTLHQNIFHLLGNPKSKLFYEEYAKRFSTLGLASGGSSSGSEEDELINKDELTAIAPYLFTGYAAGAVPYLKIESFNWWDDAAQTKLESFYASISDEEHLIIDVRGNGGGSDGVWMSRIVPFLAQPQQKYTCDQFWAAKSGALNLALEPEFEKSRGNIIRYTDDSWQEEFPYISPDMLTGMDLFLKFPRSLTGADIPGKFHGKVWVLVDEYCYSATEALVCFCKETGFATLVGTKTGGSGKGAAPYYMALPYSGLIVAYETYLAFNTDGTCNATSGTVPDIVPEEGRGALETCLMAINGEL